MTRFTNLPIPPVVLGLLLAAPAVAGEHETCDTPVQECLNHMVTKLKTTGFIGVEYEEEKSVEGIVVTSIIPGTAAEKAGIQAGDVLKTLNGIPFAKDKASYEKMAKVKLPGKEVTVTLTRDGADKTIKLTLAPMPADLMAKYIGEHMMLHANQAKTQTAEK